MQKNWTALHIATLSGRLESARLLIERGANVNDHDNVSIKLYSGTRPLGFVRKLIYNCSFLCCVLFLASD